MTAEIVVYGATGLVGRRVCHELDAAGAAFAIAGRSKERIAALAAELPAAEQRIATVAESALVRAFAGARVIVNCAGPLDEIGEPVLVAALAAGAHYLDLGGDQRFMHAMLERHESSTRRAGLVAMPGAALNCAIGDWAAAWAAQHVCGTPASEIEGDVLRTEPAAPLGADRPFDDVSISYIYDDLVLSPAGQRAVFANLHERGLAWRRDRWEPVAPASERRRINAGVAMGGERDVASFPGGDVITVPRHIATRAAQTFVSTTRHRAASTALRLLARAMPLVPKRATELLVPYTPKDYEYERTRFAVVAQVRRGFSGAQIVVGGGDQYLTSAVIAAWVARQLAARSAGPVGMRAPSELFRPAPALREIAAAAGMTLEPSFA
ncbi:MAG: Saccharopine dehydrogenase [Myxococcales bacterium]|nr:Saccharopine dehydrogenase [Myxococcales bacterium]